MQTLGEALGTLPPRDEDRAEPMFMTGEQFAEKVLASREFLQYVLNSLTLGNVPAALVLRLMDYAPGWGKPADRVEHTGKDGRPIETITEVRRVVIHVAQPEEEYDSPSYTAH